MNFADTLFGDMIFAGDISVDLSSIIWSQKCPIISSWSTQGVSVQSPSALPANQSSWIDRDINSKIVIKCRS